MSERGGISRPTVLTAGGAGIGLVLGWTLWPRRYPPNLPARPGEHVLDAFLKIGEDGRITVAVGQAEMGQGAYTSLPQILADELGADWRTVGVEPAPIHPLFANRLLAEESADDALPHFLRGVGGWAARQIATRSELIITAGSTSIRAFEAPFRAAGATARALLCMAAAKRWEIDWEACDARDGFVVRGEDRLRFAELAAQAATMTPPGQPPLRGIGEGGLSGRSVQRLDVPAKVDGSARYAGDVRLPNMVFASVYQGPSADSRLRAVDRAAADNIHGVIDIVENPGWVAAVATNWWAADRAARALRPRYETAGDLPDEAAIGRTLADAVSAGVSGRIVERGDPGSILGGKGTVIADYGVAMAAHAAIEPMVATARAEGDSVEVWAPTQAPQAMRSAVARATGLSEGRVTIFPTLHGGSFGRKLESDAAEQAAVLAVRLRRPVQLCWSRTEETMQDRPRPPARAHLRGRVRGTQIAAWHARIAVPATMSELARRLGWRIPSLGTGEPAAVEGALPPYAIPAVLIEHAPVEIGVATGLWRGAAHGYTAFFTECFVDELAASSGIDPLSFRIGMLGDQPRLSRVLSIAAARGGWDGGGPGSGQGLAAHSAFGSHIAMLVEARLDDNHRVTVDRVVAAVDCGRMVNPDIVRQQIEGGIVFAIGAATGGALTVTKGLVDQRNFDALRLPTLAHCPEITVELVSSGAPGGVSELAVPPLAPALANALFSATGQRLRRLPLGIRSLTMPPRIGVLLVNIGTPDAPTPAAVRRYLAEFLSDRRVVEIPPLLWQPILRGVVLRTRPAKSARAYRLVWDEVRDVSPLRGITEDQAAGLAAGVPSDIIVSHAMRYGKPAIADQLAALQAQGCDRILLAPLFPQYSGATTASAVDAAGRALAAMRRQPALRTLPAYFDAPAYISALAEDIAEQLAKLDFAPDTVVASFHGMPARTAARGDPYRDQCLETVRLLTEALGRPLTTAFQSRFGRAKWLEPSTEQVLAGLPGQGSKKVVIFAPGFAADCLETLEELAVRGRETFLAAGGEAFAYLPCLNARPRGIEMLLGLVLRELEGWVVPA